MGSSIGDILGNKKFSEPPEIKAIKEFVTNLIGTSPSVKISNDHLIINVPSAAAAGVLRFQLVNLQQKLNTKKRIIIRIG